MIANIKWDTKEIGIEYNPYVDILKKRKLFFQHIFFNMS